MPIVNIRDGDGEIQEVLSIQLGNSGGGGSADAVLYTEQDLTVAQKNQARTNIGAASQTDYANLKFIVNSTAPADAVIDQASEEERMYGNENGFSGGIDWEKYLNGQFWFEGIHESFISVDLETGEYDTESPIWECDIQFPFDVYDETYSYSFWVGTEDGDFEVPEGSIELTVEHLVEHGQPAYNRWATAYLTNEFYTKMIEEGVDYLDITIQLSITGHWRQEQ